MKLINNVLSKYGFIFFAIITFLIAIFRIPFWDEAHAFDIACLNLKEIFYLTRIEGHFILWFLILKPFTNLNLYPYPMLLINWAFCMGAIYILRKKAPFSPLVKFLITFSTPFIFYFAIVARCYSIGLFFLFLICAYYPLRYKKPYLFSSFIVLCANTSVMALIPSFYIGLIYFYDLILRYKKGIFKKKKLVIVFLIFLLCALLILIQIVGMRDNNKPGTYDFQDNFFGRALEFVVILLIIYLPLYLYKKSKRAFFYCTCCFLTLLSVFLFEYKGTWWHQLFYYIYLITLFWIFNKKIYKNKVIKVLFCSILILMLFPSTVAKDGKFEYIFSSKGKKQTQYILNHPLYYKNADIYTIDLWGDLSPASNVYLRRKGIKIYDIFKNDTRSFESIKKAHVMQFEVFSFDDFISRMDKTKNNYIFSSNLLEQLAYTKATAVIVDGGYIFLGEKKKYFLAVVDDKKEELGFLVYKVIDL